MLMLEISNLKKYYGDRLILSIKDFKAYRGDKIGIVGVNGAGKTTLLNIISKKCEADEGILKAYGSISYITQLEEVKDSEIDENIAKEFGVESLKLDTASGGERTKYKIAYCISRKSDILLADEPTSNLDIEGIELLQEKLMQYEGLLLIVSHDRELLDKLCNKIVEIDKGGFELYNGNYTQYRQQKDMKRQRAQFEFEQYVSKKKELERAIIEKKSKVKGMKKAPTRMGNSEARLHKMGNQKAKSNLERAVKAMETRLEKLEVKSKPWEQEIAKVDFKESGEVVSRILVQGKNINKKFGDREIFRNAELEIPKGSKTALIGSNGSGKTTLLKLIISPDEDTDIRLANGVKIGYFSQGMDILDESLTILENVMNTSIQPEFFARTMLARLLFKRDEIYKKVGQLSGGERVRVCFAKIFASEVNLVILDEPTNYLDIYSMEAVENALKLYEGTVLLVSHDRKLISSTADRIMVIEDCRIKTFNGSYEEYLASKRKVNLLKSEDCHKMKLVLETRLSEVLGRLSMPGKEDDIQALDLEYKDLLKRIKEIE